MRDLYATLGLRPDASLPDIKAAYKRLALQLHPDRQRLQQQRPAAAPTLAVMGVNATRMHNFQDVQEAYAVLSDDFKRLMYDSERAAFLQQADAAAEVTPGVLLDVGVQPNRVMSAMLRYAEKQQYFDDSNSRWAAQFQERNGVIERRPLSRQASREGGRRQSLSSYLVSSNDAGTSTAGASLQPAVVTTSASNACPRPLSRGSAATDHAVVPERVPVVRHHPPSASKLHEALRRPLSSSSSSPPLFTADSFDGSRGVAPASRLTTSSCSNSTRPPRVIGNGRVATHLQTRNAAAPPLHPTGQGLGDCSGPSLDTSAMLPSFRPVKGALSMSPPFPVKSAEVIAHEQRHEDPQAGRSAHLRRMVGMSAARRKDLGIGVGIVEEAHTKAEVLQRQASTRTMQIFFQ